MAKQRQGKHEENIRLGVWNAGIRSHETRVTCGSHKWRKKTATHLSPCASLNYLDADIWTQAEIIVKVYISLSRPTCPLILIPSGWLFIHSSLLSRSHLINPGEKQSKLQRIWITEQLILSGPIDHDFNK